MATTIVIDAGHGGNDSGAVNGERYEKNDNLRLALAVGKILENDGYKVIYTRKEDVYDSPSQKARIGNDSGADYFVSFHRNSSPNPNVNSGVETLVFRDEGVRGELARSVNKELEKVGFKNLGVNERPNLTVLKRTRMPAILIEAGFINTDADNKRFDENFDEMAQAIARGIENVVGGNSTKKYFVQVGLYRRFGNANYRLQELIEEGFDALIALYKNSENQEYMAVIVGPYDTMDEAKKAQTTLRGLGYDTLITTSDVFDLPVNWR